jgi:KipI family sensor histidine kinase inhibitor
MATIEPLGDQALLLRWGEVADVAVNRRVHAFAARVRAADPAWLVDCVPGYASLAVFFDGARVGGADPGAVVGEWLSTQLDAPVADDDAASRLVEIPVCYGGAHGPDLEAVAAACAMRAQDVIERHARAGYLVAMLGFSPGFPYLLGLDPALAVPRLATPRVRVPAGSVGIGGAQTGVYPNEGPGGWQLIGRTPHALFDVRRDPPAHVLPGDRVRFVPIDAAKFDALHAAKPSARSPGLSSARLRGSRRSHKIQVLAGGLQTTVQDLGRVGHRHLGVGVAGALDAYSARVGNLLVGNAEDAALLEIALQGPRLRFAHAARIAITGADIDVHAGGLALPGWRPIVLPAGTELVLGPCRRGARAYLAIAGGVDVERILGSASTDLRAGFGGFEGRALAAGDVLVLGEADVADVDAPVVSSWWIGPEPDLDFNHDVPLRVLPGHDAVVPADALLAGTWRVTAHSNRQGLRLQGERLVVADPPGRASGLKPLLQSDRLSEAVAPGTVQLPPDGQPIVLLGEAQTIGGYPRIGHVIAADLPRLAQLRPSDAVRFAAIDAAAAHALACAQRHRLTRIGLALEQRRRGH